MKSLIRLALIFVVTYANSAQAGNLDSLKLELEKEHSDSMRALIYGELGYYYQFKNMDSAYYYVKKLESLNRRLSSPYFETRMYKLFANIHMENGQYDSSDYFYDKALAIVGDDDMQMRSALLSNLALNLKKQGRFEESLAQYMEASDFNDKAGFSYGKFICLLNIANTFNYLGQFENAIKYGMLGDDCYQNEFDERMDYGYGTMINNLGISYFYLEDPHEALKYFKVSKEHNVKINNSKETARNLTNIGSIYESLNELDSAVFYLNQALELRLELGNKLEISETLMELGITHSKRNENTLAEDYFNRAIATAKEINKLLSIEESYQGLSEHFERTGNSEKALENYKFHILYKDSIEDLSNMDKVNELTIQFETEKKEKEILEKEAIIVKEEKKKNFLLLLASILFVASILLWYAYSQVRKRKKQEILTLTREHQIKSLETLLEGEEKERSRIAIELHDGVNGDLSALKYKLSSLAETNNKVINEAIRMIDSSCEQVRAISHNLTPPSFEKYSLPEVLENYCISLNESQKMVNIQFRKIGSYHKMHKKDEVAIFRIVQELMTNSLKHAKASELDIQASYTNQQLQISVEDNGIGFNRSEITSDGIGLANIDSRVTFLGGELDFSSNEKGTSYVLEIDLKDHGKN